MCVYIYTHTYIYIYVYIYVSLHYKYGIRSHARNHSRYGLRDLILRIIVVYMDPLGYKTAETGQPRCCDCKSRLSALARNGCDFECRAPVALPTNLKKDLGWFRAFRV